VFAALVVSRLIEDRTGWSVRRFVRERVAPLPPFEQDPLWEMVGVDDYDPGTESIDDVVYR